MRVDANVSVRPVGSTEFGTRCEIKNLNSLRSLGRAIDYEAARQIDAARRRRHGGPGDPALGRGRRADRDRCAPRKRPTTTATSPSPTWCRSAPAPSGSPRWPPPSAADAGRPADAPGRGCSADAGTDAQWRPGADRGRPRPRRAASTAAVAAGGRRRLWPCARRPTRWRPTPSGGRVLDPAAFARPAAPWRPTGQLTATQAKTVLGSCWRGGGDPAAIARAWASRPWPRTRWPTWSTR